MKQKTAIGMNGDKMLSLYSFQIVFDILIFCASIYYLVKIEIIAFFMKSISINLKKFNIISKLANSRNSV